MARYRDKGSLAAKSSCGEMLYVVNQNGAVVNSDLAATHCSPSRAIIPVPMIQERKQKVGKRKKKPSLKRR